MENQYYKDVFIPCFVLRCKYLLGHLEKKASWRILRLRRGRAIECNRANLFSFKLCLSYFPAIYALIIFQSLQYATVKEFYMTQLINVSGEVVYNMLDKILLHDCVCPFP